MELKPYNIYITVTSPADTDTPGLREENLTKPEETRLISESSGLYSSKVVANDIIASVKVKSLY
jgi:3-dehydrosphinganine reductase